ncbi:hypothetical protein O181_034740, partial [Austropuccinia psidii MF-1]|nr:hypothetical protein [Austropuccinia psidii MF-1]
MTLVSKIPNAFIGLISLFNFMPSIGNNWSSKLGTQVLRKDLPTQEQKAPASSKRLVGVLSITTSVIHELPCNNHPSGVRVFIHTPTQTPQISKSSICIS